MNKTKEEIETLANQIWPSATDGTYNDLTKNFPHYRYGFIQAFEYYTDQIKSMEVERDEWKEKHNVLYGLSESNMEFYQKLASENVLVVNELEDKIKSMENYISDVDGQVKGLRAKLHGQEKAHQLELKIIGEKYQLKANESDALKKDLLTLADEYNSLNDKIKSMDGDKPLTDKIFDLANELAIEGYADEAVKMHGIHNLISKLKQYRG